MGGRKPEHDGEASTIAQHGAAATPVPVDDQTMPASRDSQPPLDLAPGGMIGRYRLLERIGAGAMGVVWLAQDPQLDRKIAIKVVHPNLARSPDASGRLQREARAMAKLSHRAVVTVHDAGDVEGRLFLAMELVNGTSLGHMLRSRTAEQRLDWRKWLTMMLDAGRGLEAAHGANVLHRDFKPDNVLVDTSGRVCVADFGLATLGTDNRGTTTLRTSRLSLLELTTTGALLGTPAYMSPQQLRGEDIDARADQFSFCVATYEAIYGRRPFLPTDPDDALGSLGRAIEAGELPAPPADSTVPAAVHEVLRSGLAADPQARWPSMTALLDALERAARVRSTAIRVATPDPRTRPLVLALAAGAVAVIVLIVAVVVSRRPAQPAGVTSPPTPAVAKARFEVSLRSRMALSPDGRRVAIGSDRIEVRELDGPQVWTMPLGPGEDVSDLELTNDDVKYGVRRASLVRRWRYATDGAISESLSGPRGAWSGTTSIGELFHDIRRAPALIVVQGADIVRSWSPSMFVELIAVSPDGSRIATIEADRFFGKVVIRDVVGERVLETPTLDSPTALAWLDDHALAYATGASEQPRIWRVAVGDRIAPPVEIYGVEHGWFGEMVFAAGRLLVSELNPRSRARLVDGSLLRDLDAANIGVALGWTSADEYLTWSRSTRRVERRTLAGELRPTEIELAGEAANATISGDILIVAVRGSSGREVVAHSLTTGALLWRHPSAATLAVRCAEDLHPPCFALRRADHLDQLVTLDPQTGEVGAKVLFEGVVDDLAVSAGGDRVLIAERGEPLLELTADGVQVRRHTSRLSTIRSVAFDHDGGYLIAGTQVRATYAVGRVAPDGSFTMLAQASNDLLSLVRPSPDGQRALVLARVYAPMVWELAVSP